MQASTPPAISLPPPPSQTPLLETAGPAAPPRCSPRQPRDYVLCSLFTFAFLDCCCLGFLALVYSFKSRDCKVVGDVESATVYGKKAKCLNTISIILSVVFFIIVIILFATGAMAFPKIVLGGRQ